MNVYRFIILLLITVSVQTYASCILTSPTQLYDDISGLVWRTCPVGQTLKNNTCQGQIQKFNWLEAMRYALPETKNTTWRLPTSKELATIFTQCTPEERAHAENLTGFWSRDRADSGPDKNVLQALMVATDGSIVSEYKTTKSSIFMVKHGTATILSPILWSDDEWMEPRERLDRALVADNKTGLAQAAIFETTSQWVYALRLYEGLQKRKGAQKLTPAQLKFLTPKILDLQTRALSIP